MSSYRLTDVTPDGAGVGRTLHGLATRSPLNFARRAFQVATEIATADVLDRVSPLRSKILEVSPGSAPVQGRSMALYLHWSPQGLISPMVRRQVQLWRQGGFDVVFITNAAPPARDWAEIAEHTTLRIRRTNTGRDFGAWRDGLAEALRHHPTPAELLLANDSVLGPFKPLDPLLDAWRAGGEGLFGLTESWGGGTHLQSYALLARGQGAIQSLSSFLQAFQNTRSKWRVVQRGEIALTRHMLSQGHRCAALFGYADLSARVDEETRASLGPRFSDPSVMLKLPLNPAHHLWRVLIERMAFPYLKTELVRINPGRLPGVTDWARLLPPTEASLIQDHLAVMGAR